MRRRQLNCLLAILLLALLPSPARTQSASEHGNHGLDPVSTKAPALCAACVHADMAFLADDEMRGRGSGTRDEHLAAAFAASLLESFGLEPGGDHGTFLQKATLPTPDAQKNDAQKGDAQKSGAQKNATQKSEAQNNEPRKSKEAPAETWNTIGILRGYGNRTQEEVILLTAHIDHLGVGKPVRGDAIYNGADDDASGTTAVLELARALVHSRPRRTILFVLFGSEETGGFGSQYFLQHPPVPIGEMVANLEFEMIGRSDPTIPRRDCWLTGYERSSLGPALVRHGALLVADPRPKEKFFERSDNYSLARRGVVAHTISSFSLHADYHQPSDDLSRIDFNHLTMVIRSMINPIDWLANTTWKPTWNSGGRPR